MSPEVKETVVLKMATCWASIVKQIRPAAQVTDPTEAQRHAVGVKVSQKNALAHAKTLARVAATRKYKTELNMMDRIGAQLTYYEDMDLVRCFAAKVQMDYDTGGIPKGLASDLLETTKLRRF